MTARGQTQTLVVTFYAYPGGPPTDATDVTLALTVDGDVAYGPFTPTHDATGRYRYEWLVPLDADLGVYTAEWSGTLPGEGDPSVAYETFNVTAAAVSDMPDFPDSCWPVDVSCVTDWDDTITIPADPDAEPPVVEHEDPKYTDRQKAYAVALAGQTMRMLTAYRVGGCPITVRPCRRDCIMPSWQTYPVLGYAGSSPWVPVNLGGAWINIGCGHSGGCGCSGVSEVLLHGPASAVTEVKVDGVVLDPTAYRLDAGGRLVRVDGDAWPLCQDLGAPDTEDGTWSVTYRQGVAVDGIGAMAAGALAGQYVRACSGTECDLPKTVTQVVRNGVTVTLAPGSFPGGKTGVREVDAYLERWNPSGRRGPPMTVWSPDLNRPRG